MYDRIKAYVEGAVWAISDEKWRAIQAILAARSDGFRLTAEEIAANVAAVGGKAAGPLERHWCGEPEGWFADGWLAAEPAARAGRQTVAVIRVFGVLAHRAGSFGESSGGTSTERLAAAVRQAGADPSVKGLVLDVNSPGGIVEGVQEVAKAIRDVRKVKPVEAVVNAHAESGGYWIASAADHLTAIPSSFVGSLGIFTRHTDASRAEEMRGEKTTIIRDTVLSKFKAEGLEGPLTEEARAHWEGIANSFAQDFGRDVASGRGVSVETVRKNFGQGRTLPARDALAAGMIDGIGSLEDAVRRVARGGTPQKAVAATEGLEEVPTILELGTHLAATPGFGAGMPTVLHGAEAVVPPTVPPPEPERCAMGTCYPAHEGPCPKQTFTTPPRPPEPTAEQLEALARLGTL